MKKILENWKKFNLKEQNELDTPSPQEDPVDIMRSVLEEVQNMASRLIEIEEQLKKKKDALMKKKKRTADEVKTVRQLNFAINAKQGDYK